MAAVHLVVILDTRFGGDLFFPECAAATVKDYYLFVLDNLAKGVLVDVLESYNINLYRCADFSEPALKLDGTCLTHDAPTVFEFATQFAATKRPHNLKVVGSNPTLDFEPTSCSH